MLKAIGALICLINVAFSGNLPDETVCGKRTVSTSTRIVNGTMTRTGEFPYIANVAFAQISSTDLKVEFLAAATIVNRRFLLTAAHLSVASWGDIVAAHLGQNHFGDECTDPNDPEKCPPDPVQIFIDSVYVDTGFHKNETDLQNDIGLLYLKNCINFTDFIAPVCLPQENYSGPTIDEELTGIGWGNTGAKDTDTSEVLRKVELPVLSKEKCEEKIKNPVLDNEICLGSEGKGFCVGDSGGPVIKLINDHWYQVGVISRGIGCADGTPAIATKVTSFRKFIEDTLNSKCNGDWNCGCPQQ